MSLLFRDCLKELEFDAGLPSSSESKFLLLAYADDEGVRNNNGRAGAARGPERIIHFLNRLPVHLDLKGPLNFLKLPQSISSLAERHQVAEDFLMRAFSQGWDVITIGGGHDYGYPDAAAFYQSHSLPILNVDAHLDVRPVVDGIINSGTPFFRFAERFGGRPLIEWGIQAHSNSKNLFQYAKDKEIQVYSYKDPMPEIKGGLGLSICLDAFAGIRGVSAPALVGLSLQSAFDLINRYAKETCWIGVYESAPELDPVTEDSARFAARLISQYIHRRGGFDESSLFS